MESSLLDFFLSFYTRKSPKEEFVDSRRKVSKVIEQNFKIINKGYMTPFIGRFFPVYTHYKLQKTSSSKPVSALMFMNPQRPGAKKAI